MNDWFRRNVSAASPIIGSLMLALLVASCSRGDGATPRDAHGDTAMEEGSLATGAAVRNGASPRTD